MAEYIEREAILGILRGRSAPWDGYQKVKELPAADVRPVVRGRWTEYHTKCDKGYGKIYYQHEECSCQLFEAPYNYCPNCGADMGEEEVE